jgi:hypothetical protein
MIGRGTRGTGGTGGTPRPARPAPEMSIRVSTAASPRCHRVSLAVTGQAVDIAGCHRVTVSRRHLHIRKINQGSAHRLACATLGDMVTR